MKILLATAKVDEIRWATVSGLVDGVLTAPALLRQENRNERELLADICRAADGPVYATVHAVDGDETYRDGREMARISDQIVVQLPLVEDTISAVRRLTNDGIRVAALLVFNAAQALLAAKAGATSVITPVDHLDEVGHSGLEVIRQLRSVFDASSTECDVVAARPATATQFAECALAGADAVAVTPEVLRTLLVHPLTDRGIDQFLGELSKQHAPWTTV
jgi:transaldolase